MKNPFLSLFRARDKPRDAISAAPTFYFGSSTSGKSVNPKNAVQVSAVYACVRCDCRNRSQSAHGCI